MMERCGYFRWQRAPEENIISSPDYEQVCKQGGLFACPPNVTCPIREKIKAAYELRRYAAELLTGGGQ